MAANGIYLEAERYHSLAFKQLSRKQVGILFAFMERRQFGSQKKVRGKSSRRQITNNGEIVFTYKEAREAGFSDSTFAAALTRLVEVGFIDISYHGNGNVNGDWSRYACSERWRNYGKPEFISKTRAKDPRRSKAFEKRNQARAVQFSTANLHS
jgi:hypothetical protein